jgi:hypothetical protein
MKAKLHYLLIFGLLFLHPHYTRALEPRQTSGGNSFQKIQTEHLTYSEDSQNQNTFLFADVDVDDDDDSSFSVRKKISFEGAAYFDLAQFSTQNINEKEHAIYDYLHSYQLAPSHFISLRVFRL